MSNERLMELMTRKLSGEADETELRELELLLSSDAGAMERYKLLQKFWEHHDAANPAVVEESLQKVLKQLDLIVPTSAAESHELQVPQRSFPTWVRVAAAVLIILTTGLFLFQSGSSKKVSPAASTSALIEKQNSKGVKSTIELSDGSKIWLNADSKIEYPEVFAGNTREITLRGEAFFDVAKNPAKPFIIHLSKGTIRVLGTSFNVRAYDDEKFVSTSVATGKVAFIPRYKSKTKKQDTLFITPNYKVRYAFNNEKISVSPTISKEDKAWTEGKLIYKDIRLEDMAVELERNFGKKVVFISEKVKNYRITGSFPNDTLDNIMFYLSRIKDLKYKITSTELIIGDEESKLP